MRGGRDSQGWASKYLRRVMKTRMLARFRADQEGVGREIYALRSEIWGNQALIFEYNVPLTMDPQRAKI